MHLRDVDGGGDLRLCEVFDEAHAQDRPLTGQQISQAGCDGQAELDALVVRVVFAERSIAFNSPSIATWTRSSYGSEERL